MPSQFLACNAATQPSPTHCARFSNSPLADGCGCTIRLPSSAKARRPARTPMSSRPSTRLTGRSPTKSSQLAPVTPLTPRTAPPWALSYIWPYPPTCPARMLAGAFRYSVASPVPIPTTIATCRSICPRSRRNMCSTIYPRNPPPYHVTQDDVSTPLQRLEMEKITGHQSVRGRGGVNTVMYETHWTGLSRPSWEREMDLQLSHHEILRY